MARWREREAGEKEAGQAWAAQHGPSGRSSPGAAGAGGGHCLTRPRSSSSALALARQGPPPRLLRPGPVRREHHDRVLHDGADAGLGRGLLHLQPHAGRPPELPAPLRRQRLLPCRPLSPPQGGPWGPLPTPACSAWGHAAVVPAPFPACPRPPPVSGGPLCGVTHSHPPARESRPPARVPCWVRSEGPTAWPHRRQHLLHWGLCSHRPAPTPCPQTLGPQQMPLLRGSCSLGVPTPRQHPHAPWYPPHAIGLGACLPREPDQPPRFLQPPVIPEGTV